VVTDEVTRRDLRVPRCQSPDSRAQQPNLNRPYRIWLYPVPLFLAGVGWTFVYCTLPLSVMLFSVVALLGAVLLYVVWRKGTAEPDSPAAP
jgi:hypothetical protein